MSKRIDIRDIDEDPIIEIVFGEGALIRKDDLGSIRIEDATGESVRIHSDEINNLIKALKKAKEFGWCD